jgi:SAM domain (Sterile alpha motif)
MQVQQDGGMKPEALGTSGDTVPDKNLGRWRTGGTSNDDDDDDDDDGGGFSQTGIETIKSSSGSSVGLLALGMESRPDVGACEPDLWRPVKNDVTEAQESVGNVNQRVENVNSNEVAFDYGVPSNRSHFDLRTLLCEIGLAKYASIFEEQDVDFDMFLTLTDNDLKEIGIK